MAAQDRKFLLGLIALVAVFLVGFVCGAKWMSFEMRQENKQTARDSLAL